MRITKIIGKSFELWISNPVIMMPFIIQFLAFIVLTVVAGLLFSTPSFMPWAMSNIEAAARQLVAKMMESYYMLGLFVLLLIIAVIISCFLTAGAIGIANEICRGKKARFSDIIEFGKKFWFSYLITSILIGLLILFSLVIIIPVFFAVSLLGFSKNAIDVITIIFGVVVILFAVILIPSTGILIVKNTKPMEAIKTAFRLSKGNYLSLLALLFLFVLINAFTNLIPSVGDVIGFLILNPVQTLAIVLFLIDRLPGIREKGEREEIGAYKMQIYEPAEDSLLMAECLRKICREMIKKNPEANFVDMGTGSCIQAETALKSGFSKKNILTADISKDAVKNARKKGFKSINSDLFCNIKGKFDLIEFNPPYLPYNKYDNNKDTCGGKRGYETAVRFIKQLKSHIKENGIALLLISSLTNPDKVKEEIIKQNLKSRKIASSRLFFEEIFVIEIKG